MESILMGQSKAEHLDTLSVRRAQMTGNDQVRYKVYQSPTEFIAVIAESALLALRIAGIVNPYKVVRDLPVARAAVEKGLITVPESMETVPLSTQRSTGGFLKVNADEEQHAADAFIVMPLMDIYKKKISNAGILSRDVGMSMFGMAQNTPTLTPPAPKVEVAPPPPAPVEAAPLPESKGDVLSQEEISKLLGDI